MQTITIPTSVALADQRYTVTGRRLAILRIDAPILLRVVPGGPQLPILRPGRIISCATPQTVSPTRELFVTLGAADVVAGGSIVVAADDEYEFDFPGTTAGAGAGDATAAAQALQLAQLVLIREQLELLVAAIGP
jgi:hypothetical protein